MCGLPEDFGGSKHLDFNVDPQRSIDVCDYNQIDCPEACNVGVKPVRSCLSRKDEDGFAGRSVKFHLAADCVGRISGGGYISQSAGLKNWTDETTKMIF